MSLSGVGCSAVPKEIPGIFAAVAKYSTFGSLIIENLNCTGLA